MSDELEFQDQQVIKLATELQQKKISLRNVPLEYFSHPLIVKSLIKLGLFTISQKGYDVIRGEFFIEGIANYVDFWGEFATRKIITWFRDFSVYYNFLEGEIYDNACYYKCLFKKEDIEKYSIDLCKIQNNIYVGDNIDKYTLTPSLEEYREGENVKRLLKKRLEKLYTCKDVAEFNKILDKFKKSRSFDVPTEFWVFNYILRDLEQSFDLIIDYVNNSYSSGFEKNLCLLYDPNEVINAYNNTKYTVRRSEAIKKELITFSNELATNQIKFYFRSYFDERTHYFTYQCVGISTVDTRRRGEIFRYFETFNELAVFLHNDLTNCDLSKAVIPDMDLSQYIIDSTTQLPIQYQDDLKYIITKYYDRRNTCFIVRQEWTNAEGKCVKQYQHSFDHFFNFVNFLKYDLSDADLLFCDGLTNINDFTDLNLNNARLRSDILDKVGVHYEIAFDSEVECLPSVLINEEITFDILSTARENNEDVPNCQKVYYISDLHLQHRLKNANCKSDNDIQYTIQRIIDSVLEDIQQFQKNILLIGGDTSSELVLFKLFTETLRKSIDERCLDVCVFFTLGNHELWEFAGVPLGEIVSKYNQIIKDNNMYLLQNNIIVKRDNDIEVISTEELIQISSNALNHRLLTARIILFGGIGFAGYNDTFNANMGIYRRTINREQEIEETQKFELLYAKICKDLVDRSVIVFTHMPQKDWCLDEKPHSGFVYVNGHTHRNYFYDDGEYRIYSDNQIGYKSIGAHLKYFHVDDDYDIFTEYQEGIHEIDREQYWNFNRGKKVAMSFNRPFKRLYMLKKNGYYMFIVENNRGKLLLLNGGSCKKLEKDDLEYYFDRMDHTISLIKSPMDKYSAYQKKISEEIKSIGGKGSIHGAIVDIDFFNHIYVNPIDLKVTAYCATDIVQKMVYKDIPTLLQEIRPELYQNYLKMIESKSSNSLVLKEAKSSNVNRNPQLYLETGIYRASREIRKMQKLNSGILSIWMEPYAEQIECDSKSKLLNY